MGENYRARYNLTKENKDYMRRMVKRANQRLVTLRKQKLTNQSASYRWIQSNRQSKIFGVDRHGEVKFRTDIASLTRDEFKSLRQEVERFLEASSSTPTGIRRSNMQRWETYKKKKWINDDMEFEQFEGLMTNTFEKLFNAYGSTNTQIQMIDISELDDERWNIIEEMVEEELQDKLDLFQFMKEYYKRRSLPEEEDEKKENENFDNDHFNKQFEDNLG